jgi:hypothetical protein
MASLAPKVKKVPARTGDWSVSETEPVSYKTIKVIVQNVSEETAMSVYNKLCSENPDKLYTYAVNLRGIL